MRYIVDKLAMEQVFPPVNNHSTIAQYSFITDQ
jgi:hypothetical protein